MAYILEETKGNLPVWLAPTQVAILPVKNDDEELVAYANEILDALDAEDIRVDLDNRSEKLGYRLREAQIAKTPYLLVLGNNERNDRTVSYRLHGQQATTTVPIDEFVKKVVDEIKTKKFAN
jgi:threonyl-tRNA synthetase